MNCPIVIDKTFHSKVEYVAKYLNSEILDDPPKTGSFLCLANEMLTFSSYFDDELRSLNIDFLSGPIGWRLNRSEHEKHIKKALGKSLNPLNIFDATAGMLADTMIFLSLGHQVVACEQSNIIYLLIRDACERAKASLPFLDNLTLLNGDARDIYNEKKYIDFDVIYLDPLYPKTKKASKGSGEIDLLRKIIDLEGIEDAGDSIFHTFQSADCKKIILKRPIKAPLICNKINYQIKGKSTRFDIYI
jgi:16S rRNA (guanine1516-N2)-methyltransferase